MNARVAKMKEKLAAEAALVTRHEVLTNIESAYKYVACFVRGAKDRKRAAEKKTDKDVLRYAEIKFEIAEDMCERLSDLKNETEKHKEKIRGVAYALPAFHACHDAGL